MSKTFPSSSSSLAAQSSELGLLGAMGPDATPSPVDQQRRLDWNLYLSDASAINLPSDRPRSIASTMRFASRSGRVARGPRESLRELGLTEQVPVSIVLLSAFQVLLLRYTAQEDFLIACSLADVGSPASGEPEGSGTEFVLRADISGDPTFRSLVKRMNASVLGALSQGFALGQLLQEVPAEQRVRNHLFRISFSYETLSSEVEPKQNPSRRRMGDLPVDWHLEVEERDQGLTLQLFYNTSLFDATSVDRVLGHFHTLLGEIPENSGQQLSRLPILTKEEERQILVEWNQTDCDYPRDKCLHELVEEQVERSPERVAMMQEGRPLTYSEFNSRANQLAHYLRSRGVGPNVRVGICLDPSFDFGVAVLAVLKAGGACVPLDPAYPRERLAFMLHDVEAQVVITREGVLPGSLPAGCEMLFLANKRELLSNRPQTNLNSGVGPSDIAYVIYTSGSTGQPRGVLLAHAGLVNYNASMARMYSLTPDDRVLQFCSLSFDVAVEELFVTWISGATVVLKSAETPLAIPDFLAWTERQQITVLDLPTAYWHEWVHHIPQLQRPIPKGLRLVIVGGERAGSKAYATWARAVGSGLRWINCYGPTEASIAVTAFEPIFDDACPMPENVPIGTPLANVRVYLLDSHGNPVPVGVAGELHIGGVAVARGYLNRPEITAQKFILDPFSSDPEARLYKTGDLARYLASGEIEFLGRTDDQVKIRGFRVELGEIEAALAKHAGVREAVVIAREDVAGDKRLVGYVVPAEGVRLTSAELRGYLQPQLPDYMVPSGFVVLQTMPLTPNGKINRRKLPAPEVESSLEIAGATNALESRLVKIWEEVFGKRPIGIHDDFFELGGHSLLAARLMHSTGQAVGKVLPLAMLFESPTIRQLAAVLEQGGWSQHWSSLVPIQPRGSQPPFFCVHGVGGNVLGFRDLGRYMGPDYPLFGLQSHGLDGKHPCHKTIAEMAAHYISEIRSLQPKGPYFIGGFSLGGLIAYEMAQQLRSAGEKVGLLVLFDTYPGSLKPATGASFLKLLLTLSWQRWFHELPRKALKRIRRSLRHWRVPQVLKDVRDSNAGAADRYVPQHYAGRVTLIRAAEILLRSSEGPHAAWAGLVDSLDVHQIPGDHYDMLVEPQVKGLAEYLKSCIDKARLECEQTNVTLKVS